MSTIDKNHNATDNFIDVRAIFSKKDRARYISHLDLYRAMQRSFRRARIPMWHTQGFNQRTYLTFALALSLGFESTYEVMDFRITEDIPLKELEKRIQTIMPAGLEIVKLTYPVMKAKDIAYSDFLIRFTTNDPTNLLIAFNKYTSQDRIVVYKKNKKKQLIETDIKPYIKVLDLLIENDILTVTIRLPAGNNLNINPSLIGDQFVNVCGIPIEKVHYTRTRIIDVNGNDFL